MQNKGKHARIQPFSDAFYLRRFARRLGAERAAVFLEFALAFPVVLAFSLFIIEMCLYWDTAVMANHAAFALARIAKVQRYQGTGAEDIYPKMRIDGRQYPADQVVAAMFMMGPTLTYYDDSQKSDIDINFYNYFEIGDKLWEISVPGDSDPFRKLLVKILNGMLDPVEKNLRDFINKEIDQGLRKMLGDKFGDAMNQRFKMAYQRTSMDGVVNTEIISLPGTLAFPSDDATVDDYEEPEIVKVSIHYPMHKGGWLYSPFFYMAPPDGKPDAVYASGRHAMLVEPAKNNLKDYFAKDDGSADLDPDEMKKQARKRAKEIVDKHLVPLLDEWEKAIRDRIAAKKNHGGSSKEYKHARSHEQNVWKDIKKNINKFAHTVGAKPKDGGLCGDKSDSAGFFCNHNPTDFTKCARTEYNNAHYCEKVASRIQDITKRYNLWVKPLHGFPYYVTVDDAYPNHSHGLCSSQYFCNSP